MGQWLCTQRTLYRNSRYRLSSEQIVQLESIGMQWLRYDACWERNYEAALGKWMSNLRTQCRNGGIGLGMEQIEQLNALSIVWEKRNDAARNRGYKIAEAHYRKYGNLDVTSIYKTPEDFA